MHRRSTFSRVGSPGPHRREPRVAPAERVSMSDALEKELAKSSVGLVKAEDYKRKREQLEIKEVLGKARADGLAQAPTEEVKKKKKKKEKPSGLSFDDELDGEADVSPNMGNKKMGKCQNVGERCSAATPARRTPRPGRLCNRPGSSFRACPQTFPS